MLGKYIKVDGVQYPNPITTKISFENNEQVNKSEAGTELVSAVRLQKFSVSMKFQFSSYWRDRLREDAKKLQVSFDFGGYVYQGRLRIKSEDLEKYSENVGVTDGFWNISATFTER